MQAETTPDAKLGSARLRFVLAVLLYGTIGPVVRFIALPSEVIVLFRGTFGSLFVWLFMRMRGQSLDRRAIRANLRWLVTSGICLGLNWIFLFAAYVHTTVAIASLCNYMAPIIVIALSPVVFGERIGPKRLACVVAAFVGIMLVSGVLVSGAAEVDLVGIALGLLAAAAFVGIVICNKKIVGVGAFDKVVVQLGTSAATVLPYALVKNGGLPLAGVDVRSWALLACICLVQTGIAYVFYFGAMGELPVTEIALLGYIEPVVSVLGSALFLHEPLGVAGAVGAAMVIVAAAAGEVIRE
jgi:drug/metabolite transporter (DMT)-like permease